jgi:hypothetical protein
MKTYGGISYSLTCSFNGQLRQPAVLHPAERRPSLDTVLFVNQGQFYAFEKRCRPRQCIELRFFGLFSILSYTDSKCKVIMTMER